MWPQPLRASAEMNITPLIDVPAETAPRDTPARPESIVVEYSADRQRAINHQQMVLTDLELRLRSIFVGRDR